MLRSLPRSLPAPSAASAGSSGAVLRQDSLLSAPHGVARPARYGCAPSPCPPWIPSPPRSSSPSESTPACAPSLRRPLPTFAFVPLRSRVFFSGFCVTGEKYPSASLKHQRLRSSRPAERIDLRRFFFRGVCQQGAAVGSPLPARPASLPSRD